jgi:hypothetical protein
MAFECTVTRPISEDKVDLDFGATTLVFGEQWLSEQSSLRSAVCERLGKLSTVAGPDLTASYGGG